MKRGKKQKERDLLKIRKMIFSKAFLEGSSSSRGDISWMKRNLVNDKTPVRFPQLGDSNNEDDGGLIWTRRPGKYLLKIEGDERGLNIWDSGTRPKEFVNELRPERGLDRTKKENVGWSQSLGDKRGSFLGIILNCRMDQF